MSIKYVIFFKLIIKNKNKFIRSRLTTTKNNKKTIKNNQKIFTASNNN